MDGKFLLKTYKSAYSLSTMPDVNSLTYVGQAFVSEITFNGEEKFQQAVPGTPGDWFAATFQGRFAVQTAGSYTFCTLSDDGSDLSVDGARVVDNGGLHGTRKMYVPSHFLACVSLS